MLCENAVGGTLITDGLRNTRLFYNASYIMVLNIHIRFLWPITYQWLVSVMYWTIKVYALWIPVWTGHLRYYWVQCHALCNLCRYWHDRIHRVMWTCKLINKKGKERNIGVFCRQVVFRHDVSLLEVCCATVWISLKSMDFDMEMCRFRLWNLQISDLESTESMDFMWNLHTWGLGLSSSKVFQ